MSERTINGVVEDWKMQTKSDDDGTMRSYLELTLQGQKSVYRFFMPKDMTVTIEGQLSYFNEKYIKYAPKGTTVEFLQWQPVGLKFWNYKVDTFKKIEGPTKQNSIGNSYFKPRDPAEEKRIIKQSCLKAAIELLGTTRKDISSLKDVLETADKMVAWVYDKQEYDRNDNGGDINEETISE